METVSFQPVIGQDEFRARYLQLHKQIWASTDFDLDQVSTCIYKAPEGYYTVDPFPLHDGEQWHLFYVTGRMAHCDEFIEAMARGDFAAASKTPYEEGEGHALGKTLFDLKFHSRILTERQGEFAFGLQGDSSIVRHGGRWLNLYSTRGPQGGSMSLAYSDNLFDWELDPNNPIFQPPDWALATGQIGHSWIVRSGDRYLIYYSAEHKNGLGAAGLLSTEDFRSFQDHGPVLMVPKQLRGTRNIEAVTAVFRDGLWHLFYNLGEGTWHAVSDRPDRFSGPTATTGPWRSWVHAGSYFLGRFHAARVFQDPTDGKWYMIYTRKEYQRHLNRKDGVLKFRGTVADESALLDGLFLCEVQWQGDQPILKKPSRKET